MDKFHNTLILRDKNKYQTGIDLEVYKVETNTKEVLIKTEGEQNENNNNDKQ